MNKRRLIVPLATEPYARDFQDTEAPPAFAVDTVAPTLPVDRREAETVRVRRRGSGRYSHVYGRSK